MSDRLALTEIGPYRIEARLGIGGMGEVYRAYDSRLDRSVAVKLIRSDASAADGVARERFRREARAAARLSHPAIVQIHDIVESGEGDAIVMELVEGEPLSQRIARGPLPIDECVRLAREIAEGLAAAHTRKILHRDLKAENVMVTTDGHAKILDFGLAKQIEGEESLTRTDAVIGTFRCMSPEQARGLELDHRSDLFSFGVLLYEMLTGKSPFRGENAPDTLSRVCTARQKPAREVRAAIPQELSDLIDHLLEKEPALRPGSTRVIAESLARIAGGPANAGEATCIDAPSWEAPSLPSVAAPLPHAVRPRQARWTFVLAAGLLASSIGLVAFLRDRAKAPPIRVAVLKTAIAQGTAGAEAELIASGVRVNLLRSLLAIRDISAVSPEQVDVVPGLPAAVARATSADELLSSQVDCNPLACKVSLRRLRGADGSVLWAQSLQVPADRPYLLSEAIPSYLLRAYPDRGTRAGVPDLNVSEPDYAEYLLLRRSFDSSMEQETPVPALLERLEGLRARSPRFIETYVLEAEALHYQFRSGRDPADLRRAADLLRLASAIAPDDPRPFESLFEGAMLGERPDEAAAALRALDRLQPGDASVLARRARLLEKQGEPEAALALLQRVIALYPSWKNLAWAAEIEYRRGKIPAARRHLEQLLARFPDYYLGRSLLAQIELFYGDPAKAAALYESLIRRRPQYEELTNLGLAYFLLGRMQAAESRYSQALALRPKNPFALLNLADVTLLLGRRGEALALYRQVIARIDEDGAARSQWQMQTVRGQALAHLGRAQEAVAAVQEALRLSPGNPQAAYESSLVFALVGDQTSALLNAERALEQGVDPRWFSIPWFNPLNTSPRFQSLVTSPRPGRLVLH